MKAKPILVPGTSCRVAIMAVALALPGSHAAAGSREDARKVLAEIQRLGDQCSIETIDAWRTHVLGNLREIRAWQQTPEAAAFLGETQRDAALTYLDRTISFMDRPVREIGLHSTTADQLANALNYAGNWRKNDRLFAQPVKYDWELKQWIGHYAFACYNRELKRRGFTDSSKAKCEITPEDKPMTTGLFPAAKWPHNHIIARCGFNAGKRDMSLSADMPVPPALAMTPDRVGGSAASAGIASGGGAQPKLETLKSAGLGLLSRLKSAAGGGTAPAAGEPAPGGADTGALPAGGHPTPSLSGPVPASGPVASTPALVAPPITSGGGEPRAHDVIGIRLGMSPAEVKKALDKSLPSSSNFVIRSEGYGRNWDGLYVSLPAEVTKRDNRFNKKADEVVIVDFANPPGAQKALAVVRYKRYAKDKTPSLASAEASLVEKYGPWNDMRTIRGANHYYWGRHPRTGTSCLPVKWVDPVYRLKDLTEAEGSTSVICQGYGKWDQCVKPARGLIEFSTELRGCGIQAGAYVRFTQQGGKDSSPVTELQTFIADVDGMLANEIAFSDLAKGVDMRRNQDAIKAGGKPEL